MGTCIKEVTQIIYLFFYFCSVGFFPLKYNSSSYTAYRITKNFAGVGKCK